MHAAVDRFHALASIVTAKIVHDDIACTEIGVRKKLETGPRQCSKSWPQPISFTMCTGTIVRILPVSGTSSSRNRWRFLLLCARLTALHVRPSE